MKTLNDLISEVRMHLQDTRPTVQRYTDAELVALTNSAFRRAKSLRPDLFLSSLDAPRIEVPTYTTADLLLPVPLEFPLEEQFFLPIVFLAVGLAQLRDDEFAVDGRAATMLTNAEKQLIGG